MRQHCIGIVAHQRRHDQAQALSDSFDAVHIGWDDDQQALGGDRNHLQVWDRLAKHHSKWSVVLEDDAQPIDDFNNQLDQALTNAPTPIVSLYLGKAFPIWWQPGIKTAIDKAEANNASFIVTNTLLHCVGVAIHTQLLPHLLSMPNQALPIDEHITRWAHHLEQPAIAYTYPSLVDHADGPTVIRTHNDGMPRPTGRRAWHTGPRNQWDNTTVEMGPQ